MLNKDCMRKHEPDVNSPAIDHYKQLGRPHAWVLKKEVIPLATSLLQPAG